VLPGITEAKAAQDGQALLPRLSHQRPFNHPRKRAAAHRIPPSHRAVIAQSGRQPAFGAHRKAHQVLAARVDEPVRIKHVTAAKRRRAAPDRVGLIRSPADGQRGYFAMREKRAPILRACVFRLPGTRIPDPQKGPRMLPDKR